MIAIRRAPIFWAMLATTWVKIFKTAVTRTCIITTPAANAIHVTTNIKTMESEEAEAIELIHAIARSVGGRVRWNSRGQLLRYGAKCVTMG